MYDLDRKGCIKPESLLEVVRLMAGDRLSDDEVRVVLQQTLSEADANGDGAIGFEEFKSAVSH